MCLHLSSLSFTVHPDLPNKDSCNPILPSSLHFKLLLAQDMRKAMSEFHDSIEKLKARFFWGGERLRDCKLRPLARCRVLWLVHLEESVETCMGSDFLQTLSCAYPADPVAV